MLSAVAARKAALARTTANRDLDNDDDLDAVSDEAKMIKERKVKKQRRWSPSVPVRRDDGDDEEGFESVPSDEDEDELERRQSRDALLEPLPLNPPAQNGVSSNRTQTQALSTFTPVHSQNTFPLIIEGVTASLLVLRLEETLCLLGTYELSVLAGAVAICGTTISASSSRRAQRWHRVYAPRCSPLPTIQAVGLGPTTKDQDSPPDWLPRELHHLFDTPGGVIVCIKTLETGVEGLGDVCKIFDGVFGPSRWMRSGAGDETLEVSSVHVVTAHSKDIQPFILPPSWDKTLVNLTTPPAVEASSSPKDGASTLRHRYTPSLPAYGSAERVILIKGPKKSGKSAFARTLVNRLLQSHRRVAYLECDIGQSEFTPGGLVALNIVENALFGPPFTHPTLPTASHFIGNTTPKSCPALYLSAIRALVRTYRDEVVPLSADDDDEDQEQDQDGSAGRRSSGIPLIVNTMGWTKGLGADLGAQIEEIVGPTDVVEVEAPLYDGWNSHNPNMRSGMEIQDNTPLLYRHHLVEPIASTITSTNYTPADHRTISMLSYFHAQFPPPNPTSFSLLDDSDSLPILQQLTAQTWDTALPLSSIPPYELDAKDALDAVFLVGAGMEDVVSDEVLRVFNGAVVGLVTCEVGVTDGYDEDEEMDEDGRGAPSSKRGNAGLPYVQGRPPPPPESSNCIGLAFVRSISSTSPSQPQPPTSSTPASPEQTPPKLHILTPIPPALLAHYKPRVLIKGDGLEMPVWGWLPTGGGTDKDKQDKNGNGKERGEGRLQPQPQLPFLQWGKAEGVGAERRRVRRNLMRRGLA